MSVLFDNPGGFIKKGTVIFMILELIGAVITVFALIAGDEDLWFLFFLLPVGFFVIIYMNMLFYGFGVLIENSGSSACSAYESRARIDKLYSQLTNGNSKKDTTNKPSWISGNLYKENDEPQKIASTANAGSWVCTCGKVHPKFVSSCDCGVSKIDAMTKK